MSASPTQKGRPDPRTSLERDMQRFQRREPSGATFWRSFSVLGTIGWSIALPAVGGAWFGHHLDLRWDSGVRFTLMLLAVGVCVGSVIAWRVVRSHQE